MKSKLLRLTVVLILGLTSTIGVVPALADGAHQQAQFAVPILIANTSFLNVRTGPGAEYTVLTTIVGGTELPVLGVARDGVWYFVATHAGNGWVNVDYTIPRGDFRNVPQIAASQVVPPAASHSGPISIGLPSYAGQSVGIDPAYGVERYRAAINVSSVNLRATPSDDGAALHLLFKDDSTDYAILGRATDRRNVEWLALDVPGVGVGWVESAKLIVRLSGRYRDVLTVVGDVVDVFQEPGGATANVPPLVHGDEVFLLDITRNGLMIKVELPSGAVGWIPFSSVVGRENTTTDDLYAPGTTPGGIVVPTLPGGQLPAPSALAIVNTGNLNIRSGPGAFFSTVVTVPGGTQLPILAIASDNVWYLVGGPFGQGWVNSEFTIIRGSLNGVPVIPWETAAAEASVSVPVAAG